MPLSPFDLRHVPSAHGSLLHSCLWLLPCPVALDRRHLYGLVHLEDHPPPRPAPERDDVPDVQVGAVHQHVHPGAPGLLGEAHPGQQLSGHAAPLSCRGAVSWYGFLMSRGLSPSFSPQTHSCTVLRDLCPFGRVQPWNCPLTGHGPGHPRQALMRGTPGRGGRRPRPRRRRTPKSSPGCPGPIRRSRPLHLPGALGPPLDVPVADLAPLE